MNGIDTLRIAVLHNDGVALRFRRNALRKTPAPDTPNAIEPGIVNSTSVPAPGALQTLTLPPMRPARSRIPQMP